MPDVSCVIVNHNGGDDLIACLEALGHQSGASVEVILVDNCSIDGSLEAAVAAYPGIRAMRSQTNDGFAGGANRGAERAHGSTLLFLNPDVTLGEHVASRLHMALQNEPGVAGPRLWVEAHARWEYGCIVDLLGWPHELIVPTPPVFVPGCALATNREIFNALGGFDARYFMTYEDADYCWRVLLAGAPVRIVDGAEAVHRGGGATPGGYSRDGRKETTAFRVLMRERNTVATLLKCAPAAWVAGFLPAYVAWTALISAGSLALGKPALAAGLWANWVWNIRQASETLAARRRLPLHQDRVIPLRGRLRRRPYVLDLLRSGAPRVVS
jgi:GT2 family glycosyltransferase